MSLPQLLFPVLVGAGLLLAGSAPTESATWPQWRGPIAIGCGTVREGDESARYGVVQERGKFGVVDYSANIGVQTPVTRGGTGSEGSFSRLFRFISCGNKAKPDDRHDEDPACQLNCHCATFDGFGTERNVGWRSME